MKSQIRFVMHPDDEALLIDELLRDLDVVLIDGPRWKLATPTTTRDISAIGNYCIIWSTRDVPQLSARFVPSCNDWYCTSEHATIQLLRSTIGDDIITEGRFAISTQLDMGEGVTSLEGRYKRLCQRIKKAYRNSVLCWRGAIPPQDRKEPTQRPNSSKPDRSLWVGPNAMSWLTADANRRVKQFVSGGVEGFIQRARA